MEYRFHDLPKTFNDVVLLPYVPDFSSPHRRLAEMHQIVTHRYGLKESAPDFDDLSS